MTNDWFAVFVRVLCAVLIATTGGLYSTGSLAANGDTVIHNPEFRAYDMSGLDYLPPSLLAKGYERIPVLFMCHMWNPKYGHQPSNCDNLDFSTVNHDVVRQRAREMLGVPLVVIDIERTHNPTSEVWHILSEDPAVTDHAVELWREMISVFREENPDTEIMIYKPIQRIWWPMIQNRQLPFLKRGQASIDARYATTLRIAPLFEDPSLLAWPSAYVDRDEPEIYREERQYQIRICKEIYKTRCIFALTPHYVATRGPNGERIPVDEGWFYRILRELEEDGADGFGIWLPAFFNNDKYLRRVRAWEEGTGRSDPEMQWLNAIDRFLTERQAAQVAPAAEGTAAAPAAGSAAAAAEPAAVSK